MDRNTIIGLLLIFAILIAFNVWMSPSKEEREKARIRQDSLRIAQMESESLRAVKMAEQIVRDSLAKIQQAAVIPTTDSASVLSEYLDKFGEFASAAAGEENTYSITNGLVTLYVSTRGGKILTARINEFQTYDSLPLMLFDPDQTQFGLNFFHNNRLISTNGLFFKAVADDNSAIEDELYLESGSDSVSLVMRLYAGDNAAGTPNSRYIQYRYTLFRDQYLMNFSIGFSGMEEMLRQNPNSLELAWHAELLLQEKAIDQFNGPTIYYKYYQDDVDYLSETKDDEKALVTRVKWVSYKHKFFCSALIAGDYFSNATVKTFTAEGKGERYLKTMVSKISLQVDGSSVNEIPMNMYFGPNKYQLLRKLNLDLERQIPLGWSFFLMAWINRFMVIPVFNFLESFGWNYGIIILVLTILLKIVLFPIAYKSYISSAKMKALKPEIEELAAKFPKKEDAMKKQQATMALYKQAGVNPMAGCVPMLLQFPILIAMFRFFPSSFELRQQSFLWAEDLSSYDSILDLPFDIPFYGDHVSLFTLLMTVSTIIYTRIQNEMMASSTQQLPGMKTMMYIMPVMFLGIFNNYASGLSYYYFLANIFTFGQMFIIRRTINEDKIRQQIEINKKKPRKKSAWQKRLEDAARQRGQRVSRK